MREPMIEALPDLLHRFAATRGDSPAVVTDTDEVVTAAQLDAAAARGAERLQEMGAGAGSVVALHGEPGPAWLAGLIACWRLGAVAAPLNHRQPDTERNRDAGILACEVHWKPNADELLAAAEKSAAQPAAWPIEQAMLRVCTSGSTGTPRCVELTLEQLWFNAMGSSRRLGHRKDDRWLVCLPVNHVGALAAVFRCLHNRIVVELHTAFDVDTVARSVDSGGTSLVSLVPAMLDAILDSRGEAAFSPRLRAILLGGAACSERLLDRCRSAKLPIALSWGMTETASQVATREPGDLAPLEAGMPPLPWVRVHNNADGRLVVRGPAARGELVSSDFGEVTAAGRVRVFGRADDVIVCGGENIHPAEIERVLESHPQIAEAVVLAHGDERLGQVPVAFVRGDTDATVLQQWCRKYLAGPKVPQRIEVLDDLPRIGPGKVDRKRLRELL
jgi:O-succinylbenzoic acid--CoA ligase